jgi:uncharacterized protein (DUF2336 family)
MSTNDRLAQLELLLRRLAPAQRAMLLNAIAEIFAASAGTLRPSQIDVIGRLLNELMVDADSAAVAALARRLAECADAPIETINQLARNDDITIAEPVLTRSPQVAESTLADVARSKSQTHLLAVAIRPQLAADISDLVATRGDEVAVRYLANNQGAQISEVSALALAERAKTDDVLAELISKRTAAA